MRKKFLAVALAATMVIGLVGCGNSSSSSNNATTAAQMTHRLQRNLTLIQLKTARLSKTSVKITETK